MTSSADPRLRAVFSATVDRQPNAIAVVCEDRFLTYAELADLTDRLARRLRQHGVRRGDVVAVHFAPSELPIIAILACHSLAATYVPLDAHYPTERIAGIIAELGVTWCVTERDLGDRVAPLLAARRTIAISHDSAFFTAGVPAEQRTRINEAEPDDPAYVTYTRDAAGNRRAVVAEHRHVAAYLAGFAEVCQTTVGDRVYQGHSLSFDGSVAEIWAALATGATLVVPDVDAPTGGPGLAAVLAALDITHLATTPAGLAGLDPAAVPALRAVVLSGGACPPDLIDRWTARGTTLLNVYGPAETTVHALVKRCEPGQPVTLGRALPGYAVDVVDTGLQPVVDGHTGELLLGGPALAAGYVGDPDLTNDRFVTLDGGRRAFRTGDRVRRRTDGELEYRGRARVPGQGAIPRQRSGAHDADPAPAAGADPHAPADPKPAAPAAERDRPAVPADPAGAVRGVARPIAAAPAAAAFIPAQRPAPGSRSRRPRTDGTPTLIGPPTPTPPLYPPPPPTARDVFRDHSADDRAATRRRQTLALYPIAALYAVPAGIAGALLADWAGGGRGLPGLLGGLALLGLLTWPALLAVALAAKWLIIGRYAAGEYPVGGPYYRKWWLVERFRAASGAGLLAGTPALPVYLRLLGARVGPGCRVDTATVGAVDLLTLGADSSVGTGADLRGWRVEAGLLRIGPVSVGARAFVGSHATLAPGSAVGDDGALDDGSALADGERLPAGEHRRGTPAVPARVPLPAPDAPAGRGRRLGYGLLHLAAGYAVLAAHAVALLPAVLLYRLLTPAVGGWSAAAAVIVATPVLVPLAAVLLAAVRRLLVGTVYAGEVAVHSPAYLRRWVGDQIDRGARAALAPLYGTLFAGRLLRLFGAQTAPGIEIDRPALLAPEMLNLGAGSHLAAGAVVGPRRAYGGVLTIAANRVGRHSEVGDGALLPPGVSVGNDSVVDAGALLPVGGPRPGDGARLAGAPAYPVAPAAPPPAPHPRTGRERLVRGLLDGLRVPLAYGLALAGLVAFVAPVYALWSRFGAWAALPAAPLAALLAGAAVLLATAALKALVLGRVTARDVPRWSPYAHLYGLVQAVYDTVAAPLLAPLVGTPRLARLLRLFGATIGSHVHLGTTALSGFDLIHVDDFATVDADATLRGGLLAAQRLHTAPVTVAAAATVGAGALLLAGATVGADAALAARTVLPPGADTPPGARLHGVPGRPVGADAPPPAAGLPRRDGGPVEGGRAERRGADGGDGVRPALGAVAPAPGA
ncbi:hypothetical protein GCM10010123_11470 [Pilimelia anulata]|uniref:AMP-dependent synthetase/ligase domain-containing protein n=1 Tax=Pilimelia anulata TaxID=53371 RepID=A0A8J3FBG2_9ACTN|nr:AMP-binding protein [Pilimelia anulata]GGJ83533.1 hypothetical protein GCM10010123_11470 [Pilimelia anulata]